jgi:flagellin
MALRNLKANDINQQRSLERLSTGLRINRASDDPSGLVISERLRAQVKGLSQAVENSQNASNLLGTAEAALSEAHTLILGIRESSLFAINSGGSSPEQVAAEQDAVDNAINAIERISATTRFGTRPLLNGVSGFQVLSRTSGISEMTLRNIQFGVSQSQITFDINITDSATRASLATYAYAGPAATNAVIRIAGSVGVEEVVVTDTTTLSNFDDSVNALRWNTGVYASGGVLFSIDYGSAQTVSMEVLTGTFNSAAGNLTSLNGTRIGAGSDVVGNLEGTSFTSTGNKISLVSNFFTGEVLFVDGANTAQSLTVKKSGLTFQLNGGISTVDRETVGIGSIDPSMLGGPVRTLFVGTPGEERIGGYLSSLRAGGENDLVKNPINSLRIIDAAIDDVSNIRAYLGAFKAYTIDTNVNSLDVAIENLTASESSIRDLDFAEETANFSRAQILFQAATAVMAQANLIPQAVLTLLK